MGTWYTVGLAAGVGVALAVLLAALFGPTRLWLAGPLLVGAAAAAALALAVFGWPEAVGGGVGAALGAVGAGQLVRGALGRGGTRGGTALLVALAAAVLAGLALIPVLGYVEAAAAPVLAARLRRRAGRTYAGLRILARE